MLCVKVLTLLVFGEIIWKFGGILFGVAKISQAFAVPTPSIHLKRDAEILGTG